jgi:hypothetical protein
VYENNQNSTICFGISFINPAQIKQVTSVAALEDLSQIAVGLCNGIVVLIKGNDIARDKSFKSIQLGKEAGIPVTGIPCVLFCNVIVVHQDLDFANKEKQRHYLLSPVIQSLCITPTKRNCSR